MAPIGVIGNQPWVQQGVTPSKIISGAQTGVDRGGLDAAIELGIEHGGWCPPNRKSEDGQIPERYHVEEVPANLFVELGYDYSDPGDHYRVRTHLNVRDSSGTLVLTRDRVNLSPGTRLTVNLARKVGRPCIVLNLDDLDAPWRVKTWVKDQEIDVINVAGPRESRVEGAQDETCKILMKAFAPG